jgi:Holliday junction resolvase
MTNYTRGRAIEYLARDELMAQGYFVLRSAGSKGAADLCALKDGQRPLLVQCSRRRKGQADREALAEVARIAGACAEIWERIPRKGWRRLRLIGCDWLPLIDTAPQAQQAADVSTDIHDKQFYETQRGAKSIRGK